MVDIKEKLDEGYIHSKIIIELLGKPKEHIEKTLKDYVERIKKNPGLEHLNESFAEPKEQDDGMWSVFVEVELLLKDLVTLMNFCFDYMPSSVDILAPSELKLDERHMTHFLNDLQGRLHDIDMKLKESNSKNDFLSRNMNSILRNMLVVVLHNNPRNLMQLSKLSGVPEKDLEGFMDSLIEQKTVQKEGDNYSLVKNE